MNELLLYNNHGEELFAIEPEASSLHDWSLMSENKLSISFERDDCVNLLPGCYVEFDGIRYYLLDEYKPKMINSVRWKYDVAFFDAASWMSIIIAINTLDGKNEPIFDYTGSAREHAEIIVANLNRRMGITSWKVGSVIDTPNIYIEYTGKYCSQILQEVVDNQNTEWWVDDFTLNIGRAEFGDIIELGYGNGLLGNIVREQTADQRSFAYLIPIGSTRNIDPTKYGHERLQLPDGQVFVDINSEYGVGELIEERAFAGIYPRYEGVVQRVRSMPATGSDGRKFTVYYIGDNLPFNPNDYEIAGLVKHITFLSGELMGRDFEVNYNAVTQEFEIITQFLDGNTQLPGGITTPIVGDKYVIWNIQMPDEYYTLASQEFFEAANKFAKASVQDVSVYKGSLDYVEVLDRISFIRPGSRVRLISNEYFAAGYYDSRITRMTRHIWYPYEINIDVSAVRVVGSITRLQTSIQKAESQLAKLSVAQPAIIKSGEETLPSDTSVYTSAKSEKEFLNKRTGGRVLAPVSFAAPMIMEGGIACGDDLFRYDFERKCWIFTGNVLVEGGVAAFSSINGFKPQTITDAVLIDGNTLGRNENGEIYVIGGAGSGGGIEYPLTWSGYSSGSYDGSASKNIAIPSLLSQLTNDAGYITSSALTPYAKTTDVNSLLTDYLPKSGGVVSGDITVTAGKISAPSFLASGTVSVNGGVRDCINITTSAAYPAIVMKGANHSGEVRLYNRGGTDWILTDEGWNNAYPILHSGNYSNYALPITGGMLKGALDFDKTSGPILTIGDGRYGQSSVISVGYTNQEGDKIKLHIPGAASYDHHLLLTQYAGATLTMGLTVNGNIQATSFKIANNTSETAISFPSGECIDIWGNVRFSSTSGSWGVFKDDKSLLRILASDATLDLNPVGSIHRFRLIANNSYSYLQAGSASGNQRGAMCLSGYYASLLTSLRLNTEEVVITGNLAGEEVGRMRIVTDGTYSYIQAASTAAGHQGAICLSGYFATQLTSLKLHAKETTITGNVVATGGIAAQNISDRRLKQNIRAFDAISILRGMGGVHAYEYVDAEVARDARYAGTHYGFIYQNVEGSELERMCLKREDGYGTLNHLDSNLISVVAGGVLSLDDRVRSLEHENEQLREEINRLNARLS